MEKVDNDVVDGRCSWCGEDPLYRSYHDNEWGRPVSDDARLFELIVLEGAQAGLSWITILRKREAYRELFHAFNPERVAALTDADVDCLLADSRIVRNRAKIRSAITNAKAFLNTVTEFGSFERYILSFFPSGKRIDNCPTSQAEIPAETPLSRAISNDMRRRGFRFFGPIVCYAFLQSAGFVNDHYKNCASRKLL